MGVMSVTVLRNWVYTFSSYSKFSLRDLNSYILCLYLFKSILVKMELIYSSFANNNNRLFVTLATYLKRKIIDSKVFLGFSVSFFKYWRAKHFWPSWRLEIIQITSPAFRSPKKTSSIISGIWNAKWLNIHFWGTFKMTSQLAFFLKYWLVLPISHSVFTQLYYMGHFM